MLLAFQPAIEMRMPCGQRDTGIAHLNHQVNLFEVAFELLLRLGDVAWIPLNRWCTHGITRTAVHPRSLSKFTPRMLIKITLPFNASARA